MKPKIKWIRERISRGCDPLSGAALWQLTSAAIITRNIYGEQLYASADGERIALIRCHSHDYLDLMELWVCDLGNGSTARIYEKVFYSYASNPYCDTLYFVRQVQPGEYCLTRLNLKTLDLDDVFPSVPLPIGRGTVSRDERFFVAPLKIDGRLYGLRRFDLPRQSSEMIYQREDVCNPHVQFEPGASRLLLVQINEGQTLDDEGRIVRPRNWAGITLAIIDANGQRERILPVGGQRRQDTGRPTGHQCWAGATGSVVLTTSETKRIYLVNPDEMRAEILGDGAETGVAYNHLSASADGGFFVVDDFSNGRLYLGSAATRRILPLCDSGASCGGPDYSHTHPYLTPDNRRVIYCSDRTGICQVYAAVIPDGFLDKLLQTQ